MTPTTLAIATIALVTLGYGLLCLVAPFGPCRKCDGTGNKGGDRPGKRRRIRTKCRRCKGTGARLRIGRRLVNTGRRMHDDAQH